MVATTQLTATEGKDQFYPTPDSVAGKMLAGLDWNMIESVLEPSAGKGNLVLAVIKANWAATRRNRDRIKIDCIEIDPYLRAILKANADSEWARGMRERERALDSMLSVSRSEAENKEMWALREKISMLDYSEVHVIHDNFLTYRGTRRYGLILMNPPFADGDLHLLKALELQKNGGAIVCLLNAETIRNPHTNTRKALMRELDNHCAQVTYLKDAFKDAERRADTGYWGRQTDEFMQTSATLPPGVEFEVLLIYLSEFSGVCDKTRDVAYSTCIEDFARVANDAQEARRRIMDRIRGLYKARDGVA